MAIMQKIVAFLNRLQIIWIIVGIALLGWGLYGLVGVFQTLSMVNAQSTEDPLIEDLGFAPYLVPVGTELAPENDQLLVGTKTPQLIVTETLDAQKTKVPKPTRTPSPTPASPNIPSRIVIPEIKLDAPVVEALVKQVKVDGILTEQWLAPDEFAAGWHTTSAPLGEAGNTVLNGHHNVAGEVFKRLVDLQVGDRIIVYSGETPFQFEITNIMILPERDATLEERLQNARWINPSHDIRLTLVTCWPYESNTHRLIIVARPLVMETNDNQ